MPNAAIAAPNTRSGAEVLHRRWPLAVRSFRLRLALLVAAALLIAQFGAQAHAYSHLRAHPAPTSQPDVRTGSCSDCLSFAPLLGTAGHPDTWRAPSVHAATDMPVADTTSPILRASFHAFRSRAPPTFR